MSGRKMKGYLWLVGLLGLPMAGAQEEKPQAKLEIVTPTAGAELVGVVPVKVTTSPPNLVASEVLCGLGGPPFVSLQRVGETNEWTVDLDTHRYPNGESELIVLANMLPLSKRVEQKRPVKLANSLSCYWGDIHSHTYYSDGTLRPQEAHQYARDVAQLDFFVLTDHLESLDDREWADLREQAWKFNEDGRFVSFPGLEWTKKQGHCNLLDPLTRFWPPDTPSMYKAAREAGVIGMFNHPGDGTQIHDALAYDPVGDQAMQLMEVRSDEEEKAYRLALSKGWHLAAAGTDDTHSPNWGNAGRWTVVLAPGLSRLNVWEALKARHCYSTLDRTCQVYFWVNGQVMGEIVEAPAPDVSVVVEVFEPEATDKIDKIELFEDGTIVQTEVLQTTEKRWELTRTPPPGPHYYFVKITQADNQKIWTAPVWVTVSGN